MSIYPGALESAVVVDGERVPYVDSRRSKDPVAPVLLIHGSGGTALRHFGSLYPMFANRRRVIALDYGSETADESIPLTLETLVAKVRAVLDETIGSVPVDVVGYSLGAAVAIRLAATESPRVRTLTTVAGWLRTDEQQRLRNAVWRHLYDVDAASLAQFSVLNAYGAPYLAKLTPSESAGLVRRSSPGPDRRRQMSLNAELDVLETATRVKAPTLVIGAVHDQIAPLHHSRQILGAVPDARLATVSAGHAVLTERPAEVFQLIDEFMLDPAASRPGTVLPRILV